ncbi:MAG: signal recognition particle protein [Rickettsiales bacterium]|jgi:signal recognition particle subunit SRP54|nr:signal recognition particle protein [Rickettsiales bacterium]
MFDNLTRKLENTFRKLTGRTTLTEGMLDDALSEIKIALLEADVSLAVAKKIIADVREKSVGQKIVENTKPAETVAKIVYDELLDLLGGTHADEAPAPKKIMLVGLQGTGKTTTAGKLALHYKNLGRNVLLASTDIYRPSAREQLGMLARQAGADALPIIENETVAEIVKRIKKENADLIIIDTAGRLQIDDALMGELAEIKRELAPDEILLTADAMAGQESLNIARIFNERVGVTGLVMTRADGDARGGGVISMLFETGAPVKWVGVGEKIGDLEQFHPDRIASRILGMGDVVSLVEKAQSVVSEDEAKDTMKKMLSGDFDLNTMKWQIEKMKKMGSIGGLLKLIPGIGGMARQIREKANDREIDKQLAIINSMTDKERKNPEIIFASRKDRIAKGSGTTVRDVENLIKRFSQMKTQMKTLGNFPGLS